MASYILIVILTINSPLQLSTVSMQDFPKIESCHSARDFIKDSTKSDVKAVCMDSLNGEIK